MSMRLKPEDRRAGIFRIPHSVIEQSPEIARRILRDCIVVKAESNYANDCIEYVALNPAFAPTNPGDELRRYNVTVNTVNVGDVWTYTVEWK